MNNRFQGGYKGAVYTCRVCGKRTRETGEGESSCQLCKSCFIMSSQENTHSDDNHTGQYKDCQICKDSLLGDWNQNYKF